MITKEQAMQLRVGDVVRHTSLKMHDGKPMHAVVTATAHVDKPGSEYYDAKYFSVAVQNPKVHRALEITNYTCHNWEVA